MKFYVNCVRYSSDGQRTKTTDFKPLTTIEADSIFDAMAVFVKEQKKLIKDNEKSGWETTYTHTGFMQKIGTISEVYMSFEITPYK